ncbi:DNA-binding response regulator [Candidatus Nomurabacteria bacterium RIFCSPHIGHO2_02_FULL_37_45]|uniref:DNA-binding response regulator n=1 Tax=Candidatus Nomurabacteria bacterium RIFCSPHIGHO2_12_FULL_37_29 TaxID=1801759 RepID=A0A1F6WBX0_9BACT|nr:MAG: DNA-binding response regulator [Candidatus Nomurabacteria bacterium RIFCSPHIGHO2_01_FULL_37_110]OGI71414.1 MAG: DNA-binding response regulator [Candidatus Nomurabacteria bacterium RIFCSPHIGHO2_02_FULL_37_45]OGI79391.1 MAG: DNA-binding response regulator [Candidatus Nomurabacteria bacterium RIFCSPHIGHO2_12_FULL_37_29]OGI84783.1 MAG: DNA-binding response regulator [Candidatus Nomurabacteria bacterium RIFCSPLOWO2_01_FULL_37_49]
MRVMLVDPQRLFREGLKALISAETDMRVVKEVSNCNDAVDCVSETHPSVILMDIWMPGLSSLEATIRMLQLRPETKVLFLTDVVDADFLVEGMRVGARGYALKDIGADELSNAIREVSRGEHYFSSEMLSLFVDGFRALVGATPVVTSLGTLTGREREVLKMLAEGESVKDIAALLALSVKTVEAHKFNMMRKLKIHNRAHLVQYAIENKVIRLKRTLELEVVRTA